MRSVFLEKPDPLELRLRTSGWAQIWVWMPVLIAGAVIATESTNTFSAEHTGHWVRAMIEALFGQSAASDWAEINHVLRKTGHFCGYGTVCLTFLRAWLLELGGITDLGRAVWRWRCCLLAVLCTATVASLDEWHQSFIPSRTGTPVDVALDSCGAMASCGLVWLLFWRSKRAATGSATRIASQDLL